MDNVYFIGDTEAEMRGVRRWTRYVNGRPVFTIVENDHWLACGEHAKTVPLNLPSGGMRCHRDDLRAGWWVAPASVRYVVAKDAPIGQRRAQFTRRDSAEHAAACLNSGRYLDTFHWVYEHTWNGAAVIDLLDLTSKMMPQAIPERFVALTVDEIRKMPGRYCWTSTRDVSDLATTVVGRWNRDAAGGDLPSRWMYLPWEQQVVKHTKSVVIDTSDGYTGSEPAHVCVAEGVKGVQCACDRCVDARQAEADRKLVAGYEAYLRQEVPRDAPDAPYFNVEAAQLAWSRELRRRVAASDRARQLPCEGTHPLDLAGHDVKPGEE